MLVYSTLQSAKSPNPTPLVTTVDSRCVCPSSHIFWNFLWDSQPQTGTHPSAMRPAHLEYTSVQEQPLCRDVSKNTVDIISITAIFYKGLCGFWRIETRAFYLDLLWEPRCVGLLRNPFFLPQNWLCIIPPSPLKSLFTDSTKCTQSLLMLVSSLWWSRWYLGI